MVSTRPVCQSLKPCVHDAKNRSKISVKKLIKWSNYSNAIG